MQKWGKFGFIYTVSYLQGWNEMRSKYWQFKMLWPIIAKMFNEWCQPQSLRIWEGIRRSSRCAYIITNKENKRPPKKKTDHFVHHGLNNY